jgi:hypothetical protein
VYFSKKTTWAQIAKIEKNVLRMYGTAYLIWGKVLGLSNEYDTHLELSVLILL